MPAKTPERAEDEIRIVGRGKFPLTFVVKYDNLHPDATKLAPSKLIKATRKDFNNFPTGAQVEMGRALTILAEGRMPDVA